MNVKILVLSYYGNSTDVGGKRWKLLVERLSKNHIVKVIASDWIPDKRKSSYLVRFLINNLIYPDYRKLFLTECKKAIDSGYYDLVISTYPPLASMQAGYYAKQRGMKWICDLRDPIILYDNRWAGNTRLSNWIRIRLIGKYLRAADSLIFTNSYLVFSYMDVTGFDKLIKKADVIFNMHE